LLLLCYQIATLTITIQQQRERKNYAVVVNFKKLKEKGKGGKIRGISK
jgi:hypothetical protein